MGPSEALTVLQKKAQRERFAAEHGCDSFQVSQPEHLKQRTPGSKDPLLVSTSSAATA